VFQFLEMANELNNYHLGRFSHMGYIYDCGKCFQNHPWQQESYFRWYFSHTCFRENHVKADLSLFPVAINALNTVLLSFFICSSMLRKRHLNLGTLEQWVERPLSLIMDLFNPWVLFIIILKFGDSFFILV
jgi:hypothetical protein